MESADIASAPDKCSAHAPQPPDPQELLDWLAVEFVRGGWSVKSLHRLMVT
ncbi:MAG: DUF1553 domain-containing protein, partial [Planctomycetaceae bacterium]